MSIYSSDAPDAVLEYTTAGRQGRVSLQKIRRKPPSYRPPRTITAHRHSTVPRQAPTYLRQIFFSTLYFSASFFMFGSMIPPRRRSTRWRVDSFWML